MVHWMNFLLLFVYSILVIRAEDPVVQLPNGKISGKTSSTSRNHVKFWAFQGIPYAAPPTGKNRFKPPQPVENWEGILPTTSNSKMCYQTGIEHQGAGEDCLYLHVYTPVEPGSNASLPVMLNIHGGTFRRGTGYSGYISPQFLMEHEVVVVSINYRLGPFGFLTTEDAVIPGNMGLKDQHYAIQWTKNNIHLFGGDGDKITIMGQSAGSASVTYHILSPASRGLFRAAIGQSGSALNTWAYQRNAVNVAYGIAALIDSNFNKDNNSTEDLLKLLQSVDGKAIHETGSKFGTFAPIIEVEHEGAFITESMYGAAERGDFNRVPYLGGIASEEGIIVATNMAAWRKIVEKFDKDAKSLVDDDMYITDDDIKLEVGKKIKAIYTNYTLLEDIGKSIQYQGDNRYMRAPIKFAELISQFTDVYFYQFSYHGSLGGNSHLVDGIGKVGHGEDLNYLWSAHKTLDGIPESDITTVDRYVGFLTNFAKYLNPLPEKTELFSNLTWPKFKNEQWYYFDLDENLSVKQNPREFSFQKWVDIFEEYARKPFISY